MERGREEPTRRPHTISCCLSLPKAPSLERNPMHFLQGNLRDRFISSALSRAELGTIPLLPRVAGHPSLRQPVREHTRMSPPQTLSHGELV